MSWLLSPLAWVLLAALLLPLAWRARSRWLAAACALLAVSAFAAMTPLLANWLLADLERPAAAPAWCATSPPATVVVLSAGVDRPPRNGRDFSVLDLASRRRTERGVQYWRGREGRLVVISGGPLASGGVVRADLLRAYALWLRLPSGALRTEATALTTAGNARQIARMTPAIPRRIALVTSARHMPRARYAFAAAGFFVCPLPTDFRAIAVGLPGALLPGTSALVKTESALHELVGLGYYRWHERRAPRSSADDDNEPESTR